MLVGSEAIARERSASGGRRGSRLGDGKGHGKERDKGGNRSERRSPPMTALPTKTRAHNTGVGNTAAQSASRWLRSIGRELNNGALWVLFIIFVEYSVTRARLKKYT